MVRVCGRHFSSWPCEASYALAFEVCRYVWALHIPYFDIDDVAEILDKRIGWNGPSVQTKLQNFSSVLRMPIIYDFGPVAGPFTT